MVRGPLLGVRLKPKRSTNPCTATRATKPRGPKARPAPKKRKTHTNLKKNAKYKNGERGTGLRANP